MELIFRQKPLDRIQAMAAVPCSQSFDIYAYVFSSPLADGIDISSLVDACRIPGASSLQTHES